MSRIIPKNEAGNVQTWRAPDIATANHRNTPVFITQTSTTSSKSGTDRAKLEKKAQQDGFQKGYQEGMQQAHAEIEKIKLQLQQTLQFLSRPVDNLDEQVEQELLELSLAIARQILRREITIDPKHIIGLIKNAVNQLPSASQEITIHLRPDDAEIIRQTLNEHENHEHWRIVDNPSVNAGDCRITTESSFIDASIDALIARLAVDFFGGHRSNDDSNHDPQ